MRTLVMLSGGLNSVYCLVKLLRETSDEIFAHHVHMVRSPERHHEFAPDCRQIIDWCGTNIRPLHYSESLIDNSHFQDGGLDVIAAAMEAGIATRNFSIARWAIGPRHLDDQAIELQRRTEESCTAVCFPNAPPEFQTLAQVPEDELISYLPVGLRAILPGIRQSSNGAGELSPITVDTSACPFLSAAAPVTPPEAPAPLTSAPAFDRREVRQDANPAHPSLLSCYALTPSPPRIVSASPSRQWMDEFPGRHPYRCLPLSIANAFGWEILSPCAFSISWTGGRAAADITFKCEDDYPLLHHFAESNFTHGVVTFHTGYLFQTAPGWNLFATGPLNRPKDGLAAMTGIIETDWLPYPFTMNWQLTRPGVYRFARDEPFCHVFPVLQDMLTAIEPQIHTLESSPSLKQQHDHWRSKRDDFKARLTNREPQALKQAWQKFYFQGRAPDTDTVVPTHRNKLRLADPVDCRQNRTVP